MSLSSWLWLIGIVFSPSGSGDVQKASVASRDGVPIVYDIRGKGEPAIVLVHCWACDRTFWREQVDVLAERYRVVTLDLGGHGESGKNREHWTVKGLADDVQAVVDALDLSRFVLVGHSMGGPVSLEAARRMPDRVLGVVSVDTLHNVAFEITSEMIEPIAGRFQENFDETMEQMVRMMFLPGADDKTVDFVVDRALSADPSVALALFRDFANLDLKKMMTSTGAPIRGINAAPATPMMPVTEIENNRRYGDYDAAIMEGAGHFLLLEKPETFNQLLLKTLAGLTSSSNEKR